MIKFFVAVFLLGALLGCGGGGGSNGGEVPLQPQKDVGPIYMVSTLVLDQALVSPSGLTVDGQGNLYVAETGSNRIQKMTNLTSGTVNVSTVLGGGATDYNTCSGSKLYSPYGIAIDTANTLYVTERNKTAVRYADCTVPPGVSAEYGTLESSQALSSPSGIALTASGWLYVADTGNKKIRVIMNNGGHSGTSFTLAGTGTSGYVNGAGAVATFSLPTGLVAASSGNVFVTDTNNCAIRMVSPSGDVSTFAGSAPNGAGSGPLICGSSDGVGITAQFNYPTGLAIDKSDNLYVADSANNKIRRITPQGVVTTIAGTGASGYGDGAGSIAIFNTPTGITVNASGHIFVVDSGINKVRKIVLVP